MDWSNERYVRLFTRNTAAWVLWPWQARALLPLLMRAADRAGVVDASEGLDGVAALVLLPLEVVEIGMVALLKGDSAPLVHVGTNYVIRNFLEAQDAPQSDKQRAKESRSRRRDQAMLANGSVTKRDEAITDRDDFVTIGHAESRRVTNRHSSQTSQSEPSDSQRDALAEVEESDLQRSAAQMLDLGKREAALTTRLWLKHCDRHEALRVQFGLTDAVRPLRRMETAQGWKELRERIRGYLGDTERALEDCEHVLAVREAEATAKRDQRLKYFGDSVWGEQQFTYALREPKPKSTVVVVLRDDRPFVQPWEAEEAS